MHPVLIIGAGKIGSLIAFLLAHSNHYQVFLSDINSENVTLTKLLDLPNFQFQQLDAANKQAIRNLIQSHHIKAVASSLPFYRNTKIAEVAAETNVHYFDLTEDVTTTHAVHQIANNHQSAFVPQCGLAPGFINIIANHLMQDFDQLETVKLRVGALPINTSNALQYSLTWSTDGLINEYGNTCRAIENGQEIVLQPLEGLEEINIDGLTYEAFNTSGGIGSLADTYQNKVKQLNYKTMRYPGHCAKMKFLMNDLQLNVDRNTLKIILERAIPKTKQDVVIIYVSVTGYHDHQFLEKNYVRKFYPKTLKDQCWSAIQLTTASSLCAVVDIVLNNSDQYQGFIRQEQIHFYDLINNQFGQYYQS